MPPSVSILEAHSDPMKGLHVAARAGDPSAVNGASILASLREELSLIPPPSHNDEDVQPALPTLPSVCEVSDNGIVDADTKDAVDQNEGTGVSLSEKNVSSGNAANKNISIDSTGLDTSVGADIGKIPGDTHELRPLFLRMLAGSTTPELGLSCSISKILDEQKEFREGLKVTDAPVLMSQRRQAYKDGLQQRVLKPENLEVSLESFPYYLRCNFLPEC